MSDARRTSGARSPAGSGAAPRPAGSAAAPRPARQPEPWVRRVPWATLGAISLGGAFGALARFGITRAMPHPPGGFAWATWLINVTGCLLIGLLMVAITEAWRVHRLVRPFLGIGVLGGYTTFSTYVVDTQKALEAGAARTALAYLGGTLVAALLATYAGERLGRLVFVTWRSRREERR
ncbi:fluoride efflux transporter FluC [Nonomuraea rhodomycinica]|uniref:Fluoride-specific ion channel FluC n=1 Tax=Nonomuraea rhodomycinica TaxID=1712872 RepID=A0A7Y6IXL0_9ACTN|nr:CrcB family protein [Nonomuraea rhodomycinica]NUW45921.1 CrcB family protein [Nonomuraea rhodomycinica]